jgi:hypothetical protein
LVIVCLFLFGLGYCQEPDDAKAYIVLDNGQAVYLENTKGSFAWGKPYSEMEGKLVAVTGALRLPSGSPTS